MSNLSPEDVVKRFDPCPEAVHDGCCEPGAMRQYKDGDYVRFTDYESQAAKIADQQATIDRLMLEHCPKEMTEQQLTEWTWNVRRAPETPSSQYKQIGIKHRAPDGRTEFLWWYGHIDEGTPIYVRTAIECECSLRGRLVGDGCEKCNPAQTIDYLKEQVAELEARSPVVVQLGDGKFVLSGQHSKLGYHIIFHPINEPLPIGGEVPEETPLCDPIAEIRFKGEQDMAVLLNMLKSMYDHCCSPKTWKVRLRFLGERNE